jgi:hypothetical protein
VSVRREVVTVRVILGFSLIYSQFFESANVYRIILLQIRQNELLHMLLFESERQDK